MASFRPNAPRSVSPASARPDAAAPTAMRWTEVSALDDAAIRREFETLAARIRALQQRAEREAARLSRS